MTTARAKNGDENYLSQMEGRIRRVLDGTGVRRMIDIDVAKVEFHILHMTSRRGFEGKGGRPLSPTTRNEYATSLMGFTTWAKNRKWVEHDPLEGLAKAVEKKADLVHPRRALEVGEIAKWLDAALRRPEVELLTVRRGREKGKLTAVVRPAVLQRARQAGIDRRMAYLVAVWTGLRRSELAELEWRDLRLDGQVAYVQLRGAMTKSDRDDVIPLHQQAVAAFLSYKPAGAMPTDRLLAVVPTMKVLKADLKFAGIEYGDKDIGFADLHSARKSLNAMLANHGVDGRVRQAQLRHTDPRLTEGTYFDQSIFIAPQAEQVNSVPAIGGLTSVEVMEVKPTLDGAQLAQNGLGILGQTGAPADTEAGVEEEGSATGLFGSDTQIPAGFGTNGHGPASCDAGPCGKRAKGIEPDSNCSKTGEASQVQGAGAANASAGAWASVPADPVLCSVVQAWPSLPDSIRQAIGVLVGTPSMGGKAV